MYRNPLAGKAKERREPYLPARSRRGQFTFEAGAIELPNLIATHGNYSFGVFVTEELVIAIVRLSLVLELPLVRTNSVRGVR